MKNNIVNNVDCEGKINKEDIMFKVIKLEGKLSNSLSVSSTDS